MEKMDLLEVIDRILKIDKRYKERFMGLLDLKVVSCDAETRKVRYRFDATGEWCLNPYGGIHGGIAGSILDSCMGVTAVALGGYYVTTTDLNINYLKPMIGDLFYIDVECTHLGSKIIRIEARIIDGNTDVHCTSALAGFMKLKKKVEFV